MFPVSAEAEDGSEQGKTICCNPELFKLLWTATARTPEWDNIDLVSLKSRSSIETYNNYNATYARDSNVNETAASAELDFQISKTTCLGDAATVSKHFWYYAIWCILLILRSAARVKRCLRLENHCNREMFLFANGFDSKKSKAGCNICDSVKAEAIAKSRQCRGWLVLKKTDQVLAHHMGCLNRS